MAAPVPISEVKGTARENRTAAHSHIKGLGLTGDGRANAVAGGFVGQGSAREVCLVLFLFWVLSWGVGEEEDEEEDEILALFGSS